MKVNISDTDYGLICIELYAFRKLYLKYWQYAITSRKSFGVELSPISYNLEEKFRLWPQLC